MKKTFSTLAVLSVTTGRLLSRSEKPNDNGIYQLYELLGHMTNDTPYTHQLGRFSDECKPWLFRWFPALAAVTDQIVAACEAGRAQEICDTMEGLFGKTLEVDQIPKDDHTAKNPYDELVEMRGSDEGIEIVGA